jgi:hypothetical protein
MAEPVADVDAMVKQSIARIELFVDVSKTQDDWLVTVHFEDALYDNQTGEVAPGSGKFDTMVINRTWAQIRDDPECVALAQAIKDKCYEWRTEDLVAAQSNPQPRMRPPVRGWL